MKEETFIVAGIPAYNEEKMIAKVIIQAKRYVSKVIVVNDGSNDMTKEIAEALGALVIDHPKNLGKGEAIKSIFRAVKELKPDVLVILDADGQHDPNQIPEIIKPILEGRADIVVGSRFLGESNAPFYRRVGLRILSKMARRLIKDDISDPFSGFRAFSRKAYEVLNLTESGYGIEVEMLNEAKNKNLRIVEVPIRIEYDIGTKTSKRSPISQASEITGTIIKKTIERRPLLYLGLPGLFSVLIGLYFTLEMIKIFNSTRYFSIPMAFISIGFIIAGLILLTTALIIFVMTSIFLRRQ